MEIDGDTIEVMEDDPDSTEIYAEEVGLGFNEESTDGFATSNTSSGGPVTIYRLIKLEHAEALGISLQEGSVTTPNQKTKIITRNIIKLNKPPKKLVLAQKNNRPTSSNSPYSGRLVDRGFQLDPLIIEDPDAYDTKRRFVCTICSKGFRHASHLKRHINSHTGEKLYDCEICGKRFLDASTLCRHRRTHTGDRPYVCKTCQKCFGTLGSLRRHITVHNQESRPYCCAVCSKRFPDNSSFQKHRLIHTGIKPFECDVCNKSFVHVGDLNGHKKVHEELKPWKCPRCDKQFAKQSNCARHSMIHDGDKEFVCHLCGVGYNFQSSLTRHLLTHRIQEKAKRKNNRKVVILTEVDSKGGHPSEELEPSKLTLRQIKYLVRENKINFGNDSDEDEDEDEEEEEEEEEEKINSADIDVCAGDENEVIIQDGEMENEEENEGNEDEKINEDKTLKKETIIIKHVANDGNINYVIEEA